jgi:CubicO group peptidase (beta-lactamase class C family)
MRLHLVWAGLTFFVSLAAAASEPLPRASPESVGMSSTRLARIGMSLQEAVDGNRIPGAVVAIARRGKLVYFEAFGYLDKTAGTAMPKNAMFALASMTKPLAGVGAMVLIEEGRMALDAPIGRYLSPLANLQVGVIKKDAAGHDTIATQPAKRQPTIRDLMRHTSGITYGANEDTALHKLYPRGSTAASLTFGGEELIEKIATLPLLSHPGTVWDYGLSIDVLGLAIEAITGQSLGHFLSARVFQPLGMSDTAFVVAPDKLARFAKELPRDPVTGKPQSVPDFTQPRRFECGGACAVSTAADYVRFAQMLLNNGQLANVRILSRKSVELMTADHISHGIVSELSPDNGFGLTVMVRRQPAPGQAALVNRDDTFLGWASSPGSEGEYTWAGSFGTYFWVDPKEQLVGVLMAHVPSALRFHYHGLVKTLTRQAVID